MGDIDRLRFAVAMIRRDGHTFTGSGQNPGQARDALAGILAMHTQMSGSDAGSIDGIEWLEYEYGGGSIDGVSYGPEALYDVPIRSQADISACVDDVKSQILSDITDGIVPDDAENFSELHNYVDANEYGGFCDDDSRADWLNGDVCIVQDLVNSWLIAGRP